MGRRVTISSDQVNNFDQDDIIVLILKSVHRYKTPPGGISQLIVEKGERSWREKRKRVAVTMGREGRETIQLDLLAVAGRPWSERASGTRLTLPTSRRSLSWVMVVVSSLRSPRDVYFEPAKYN